MSDDWGWYFTSAERRTSILRNELESVQSSAAAQTWQLTSQLRTLQGSIETRLNALSAAFDAYVELGDIREQLAGFPDTTVIRHDVANSIDSLAAGRRADPIDDRGENYWLPHAANAVIAIANGGSDRDEEHAASTMSPDAGLFIVAACGALGRGTAVADRVPALLVCDASLNDDQIALWRAAAAGHFGLVLPAVREVWARSLTAAETDIAGWRDWCHQQAGSPDVVVTLGWLADLVDARPQPPESPVVDPQPGTALREIVARLVAQGTDAEAPLLRRARELRRRIEDPGADRKAGEADEPVGTPVVDVVREALLALPHGSSSRSEIVGWVSASLRQVAEVEAATLATQQPIREQVKSVASDVTVGSGGPETGELERARVAIAAHFDTSTLSSGLAGGATVLFAIATVVALVIGSGWAFLAGVIAIATAVVTFRSERRRREQLTMARFNLTRFESDVTDAERTVAARLDARERTRAEVLALLEAIRTTLPPAGSAV